MRRSERGTRSLRAAAEALASLLPRPWCDMVIDSDGVTGANDHADNQTLVLLSSTLGLPRAVPHFALSRRPVRLSLSLSLSLSPSLSLSLSLYALGWMHGWVAQESTDDDDDDDDMDDDDDVQVRQAITRDLALSL